MTTYHVAAPARWFSNFYGALSVFSYLVSPFSLCWFLVWACLACLSAPHPARGDEPNEWELYKKLQAHYTARRYFEAEAIGKRLVQITEQANPSHPTKLAMYLSWSAQSCSELGRYDEAETLYKRAVAIYEAELGPEDPQVATGLNNLAVVFEKQARYAEAERLHRRSLAIYEKALGPQHPDVAMSLNNLAIVVQHQGRYDEAEQLHKRALAIREVAFGPRHPAVAMSLNNLGLLLDDQSRYGEAVPIHERALAIYERVLGPRHPDVAMSLNNLAIALHNQGRCAEAEPLCKRALAIYEEALGPQHPLVATALDNLASDLNAVGRYADAEPLHKRVLAIREKILGPEHPDVATSLNNLANAISRQGRYADAEPLHQRALAIREKFLGDRHPEVAMTLINLAGVLDEQRRYTEAEPLHTRALAILEESLGPDHVYVGRSLRSLALFYYSQGCDAEAQAFIDRAIDIFDHVRAEPRWRFYNYELRANISWRQGSRAKALDDLAQALDLAELARGQSAGAEQERAQSFGQFAQGFERMIDWQAELGDFDQALAAVERSRARSLIDQLSHGGGDLLSGIPEQQVTPLLQRESAAKVRVAGLEQQARALQMQTTPRDDERMALLEQLEVELAHASDELVEAYGDIRNASPAYRLSVGRDFKPAGLAEIQSRLDHDDALVLEYFFGTDAGYLFVIPSEGEPRLEKLTVSDEQAQALGTDPGPLTAERMRQAMIVDGTELPKLLSDSNTAPTALDRLAALWELLVPKAERQALTSGKVKQLVVIPDGALALLPFETLIVEPGESPKYLLDIGPPILYSPSATVLLNLATRSVESPTTKSAAQPVLTIANPVYGGSQRTPAAPASALDDLAARSRYGALGGELAPLPHTGTESAWVSDVYKKQGIKSASLVAGLATEANVRFNAPGRRVLHFACHGLTDQAYGNFFGCLALTPGKQGAANPADDGFLTLPEIYELNLKGCELAILSACETNYGPQQKGEGVWALSRGFLVAGARRVVASNWLVDDEAAASLVSYFCGGIAKVEAEGETADHAKALHDAKRWVRQQEKWTSPYYWGTFVLVGPN